MAYSTFVLISDVAIIAPSFESAPETVLSCHTLSNHYRDSLVLSRAGMMKHYEIRVSFHMESIYWSNVARRFSSIHFNLLRRCIHKHLSDCVRTLNASNHQMYVQPSFYHASIDTALNRERIWNGGMLHLLNFSRYDSPISFFLEKV